MGLDGTCYWKATGETRGEEGCQASLLVLLDSVSVNGWEEDFDSRMVLILGPECVSVHGGP